jgi:hypothetical protein
MLGRVVNVGGQVGIVVGEREGLAVVRVLGVDPGTLASTDRHELHEPGGLRTWAGEPIVRSMSGTVAVPTEDVTHVGDEPEDKHRRRGR